MTEVEMKNPITSALKAKTLELRKSKDAMATFLIAVGSKAKDFAKVENPQAETFNDDHALRSINSFVKGAEDNIALLREAQDSPLYARAVAERTLLKTFLPVEATAEEVEAFVVSFVDSSDEPNKKKLTGPIMNGLKAKFGASLNSREASVIVQKVLNR
jgi:uncharacterized protein YqeY